MRKVTVVYKSMLKMLLLSGFADRRYSSISFIRVFTVLFIILRLRATVLYVYMWRFSFGDEFVDGFVFLHILNQ